MNLRWAVIRSWHRVGSAENVAIHDDRPAGKTCETCLRIVARQVDT